MLNRHPVGQSRGSNVQADQNESAPANAPKVPRTQWAISVYAPSAANRTCHIMRPAGFVLQQSRRKMSRHDRRTSAAQARIGSDATFCVHERAKG